MGLINKYKKIIIVSLVLFLKYFYNKYWYFLIDKKINHPYLKTCYFYLSLVILILLLIPKSFVSIKKYKDDLLMFLYIFSLELVFITFHNLNPTILFLYSFFFSFTLIIFVLNLLPIKIKKIIFNVIITLFPIYLISQTIYMSIFTDFFSIKEIVTLKEGLSFIEGVINFNYIYLIYFLFFLTMIIIFNKFSFVSEKKKDYKLLFIPFILFFLIKFNQQQPIKEARMHTSDEYLYQTVYSHSRFVSRYGVVNYIVKDTSKTIRSLFTRQDYTKEIDAYFKDNKKEHQINVNSGLFKDKNLIFIMGESFDEIAVNEVLTPNIYKLKEEGWDFTNHFVPVYPRTTCDSEIIYNTSLIPSITDGPTCYTFNNNSYHHSLANLFSEKEYQVNAFHSNSKDFYTRSSLYKGFGYDNLYDQFELGLDDYEKRYDSKFFEKGEDLIVNETGKFMSFIITLSGHSPYEDTHLAVQKHLTKVKEYYKNENIDDKVLNYIATQMELDLFVEKLFISLKEKNLLDDTVIILTSDHYPYTLGKKVYEKQTGIKEEYLKNKSPLYIWSQDITSLKYEKITQSFDLLPTIANLFELDADYTYYFGNDIFNEKRMEVAFFKDYSWYDGENHISITSDIKNKKTNEKSQQINKYYDISLKILKSNYFK